MSHKTNMSIEDKIRQNIYPQRYEIKKEDVGCLLGRYFGLVQSNDVGKRVYVRDYGLIIENDEQRDKRDKRDK